MTTTMVGLVFGACFVVAATAVLMLMDQISQEHIEGGSRLVRDSRLAEVPIGRPVTCVVQTRPRGTGRHRR